MTTGRLVVGLATGALLAILAAALGAKGASSADPARDASAPASSEVPVLVELFTSEGCSSCPPADDVLARLERAQPVPEAYVVPLAFHVDYWDDLGWPDPFASSASTARQRSYAALGGGTYTPQAVVDGRAQMVGSRAGGLERAVAQAALRAHAPLSIDVWPSDDDTLQVSAHVGPIPQDGRDAAGVEVLFALTQAKARVAVPRGENAGRTLDHTAIVRELRVAGPVGVSGGDVGVVLHPRGLVLPDLRVVAFVQRRVDRAVLGAATRTVVR
jgi:hypothetical protein